MTATARCVSRTTKPPQRPRGETLLWRRPTAWRPVRPGGRARTWLSRCGEWRIEQIHPPALAGKPYFVLFRFTPIWPTGVRLDEREPVMASMDGQTWFARGGYWNRVERRTLTAVQRTWRTLSAAQRQIESLRKAEARSQRSAIRGQRSEVGDRKHAPPRAR